MRQQEVDIVNKLGLHARASAKLTQLAAKYQCDVSLARNGRTIEMHHVSRLVLALFSMIGLTDIVRVLPRRH